MKRIPLHIQIIIGIVAGVLWSLLSTAMGWNAFTMAWISPLGDIFIKLLKLIAVPLVLFSIIKGISSLTDVRRLGRMGIKTLGFYILTTVTAVTVGLLLVNTIQPGKFVSEQTRLENRIKYELWVSSTSGVQRPKDGRCFSCEDSLQNVVGRVAAIQQQDTVDHELSSMVASAEIERPGPLDFFVNLVPENIFQATSSNASMLQVIFFAIFFGVTMLFLPEQKTQDLRKVISNIDDVFLKMVDVVMLGAPIFVFALMAGLIGDMAGDRQGLQAVFDILKGLVSYSLVVLLGLGLVVGVIYPLVMQWLVKNVTYKNFLQSIRDAQLMAFSTSSSMATLPVTMDCVVEKLGVNERTTSFVLPIGATINMDGTSLYQAVAVVFLAQFHMIDLTLGQQLTIVFTATLASIGSAAVPSAGLFMMIVILNAVGLNPAWIAIILPVDRILDMCRTVVNVTGDATVASLVAASEGQEIVPEPENQFDV